MVLEAGQTSHGKLVLGQGPEKNTFHTGPNQMVKNK